MATKVVAGTMKAYAATVSEQICELAASVSVIPAIAPHAPPSVELFNNIAPAAAQGSTRKNIGVVPRSICHTFCLRMPASTDVGQSGPPPKIA